MSATYLVLFVVICLGMVLGYMLISLFRLIDRNKSVNRYVQHDMVAYRRRKNDQRGSNTRAGLK